MSPDAVVLSNHIFRWKPPQNLRGRLPAGFWGTSLPETGQCQAISKAFLLTAVTTVILRGRGAISSAEAAERWMRTRGRAVDEDKNRDIL